MQLRNRDANSRKTLSTDCERLDLAMLCAAAVCNRLSLSDSHRSMKKITISFRLYRLAVDSSEEAPSLYITSCTQLVTGCEACKANTSNYKVATGLLPVQQCALAIVL